jgi:hypothetical protein
MLLLGFKITFYIVLFIIIIKIIHYYNTPIYTAVEESFTIQQNQPNESSAETDHPLKKPNENLNSYRFLNKSDAAVIFADLKYLNSMNSSNISARHTSKNTINQQYIKSILEVTDVDKVAFNNLVDLMCLRLDVSPSSNAQRCKKFIKYILQHKTIIAKNSEWLESGMPHTHNNIIFFPQQWFNEIQNTSTRTNNTKLLENGATLCHEIIHIIQRIDTDKFNKLYERWGFINASYIDNFNSIVNLNRENPDGLNINWIWRSNTNYYWFGAVFKNDQPNKLSDVNYSIYPVYEIDKNRKQYKISENNLISNISDFDEHRKYFKLTNNHYHPNEIVAEYFSIWYKQLINNGNGNSINNMSDSPGFIIFESWLLENVL